MTEARMQDFEKLGAFYLGRQPDPSSSELRIEIEPTSTKIHIDVFGVCWVP